MLEWSYLNMTALHNTNSQDNLRCFLRDLKAGVPVSMLIAPAAFAVFDDFTRILGYLRSLGVKAFYPVLPYADIAVWAYYKILKANPRAALICSACVGMNCYLERDEGYAGYLCPVFSPLLCAARYLKTYRQTEGRLAFLSPCLLKKNEFAVSNREHLVQYNITIAALKAWLAAESAGIQRCEPCLEEIDENGRGLTLAAFGGIGKVLAALLPGTGFHAVEGLGSAASYLSASREFREPRNRAFVFEPYACEGGCAHGTGVGTNPVYKGADFLKCGAKADTGSIFKLFSHYDATLKLQDFCHPDSRRHFGQC
jgi:iron only hydrogenase large subunit-like protein